MANNRLFLTCPHCKDNALLAVHMGEGWYVRDREKLAEKLDEFFDRHELCEAPEHEYDSFASRLTLTREHDFDPSGEAKWPDEMLARPLPTHEGL